MNRVKL